MTRRQFVVASVMRRRPNIVLLLVDDLGYGELGFQGNPEIPTPHMDSIAKAGVRYRNGYVTAPFCTPSRAGLLTGRYQTRFGHELNVTGKLNLDPAVGLPLTETTVAERLKKAGWWASGIWGQRRRFTRRSAGLTSSTGFCKRDTSSCLRPIPG